MVDFDIKEIKTKIMLTNLVLIMNQLFKIKPKHKEYIRLVAGIIILILGLIFMLVPFIPLGYRVFNCRIFLLSYKIPFFRKLIDKIKTERQKRPC